MFGWMIAIVVVTSLGIAGGIGWSKLLKEHREARNLPLAALDFNKLKDGTYHGAYGGGMYQWRKNECRVTVASGKVAGIQLAGSTASDSVNTQRQTLYDRVVKAQSIQVDTISGATLDSRAYLKSVENALLQAQDV